MPRDALISAALRLVRDAEHLLEPGAQQFPDEAYYLAGFGPECARKACLESRSFDKVLGHDFADFAESTLDVACALDPHAHRLGAS